MKRAFSNVIAVFVLLMLPFLASAKNPTMKVVIFGDTGDEKIGASVNTDVNIDKQIVQDIKKVLAPAGVDVQVQAYTGSNCSFKSLNSVIDGLSCKDDIVLFIYSGHGGRSHDDDATSKFPRMCLGEHYADKWMKISELNSRIMAKQPRLLVVVTDCCNSYYDRRGANENAYMASLSDLSGEGIRELFLNQKGNVCITAASPGEYGWCTSAGGYLTLNFRDCLYTMDKTKGASATWNELFKNVSDAVYKASSDSYSHGWISKTQRPVYEVNVTSSPLGSGDSTTTIDDTTVVSDDDDDVVVSDDEISDDEISDDEISDDYVSDDDDDYGYNDDGDSDDEESDMEEALHGFGHALSHSLVIFILGLILFLIPGWISLTGVASIIFKVAGLAIIVKALADFFTRL